MLREIHVYSEKNMTVLIEIHVYSECKKMVVRECIWRYGSDCHHCGTPEHWWNPSEFCIVFNKLQQVKT